MLICEAVWSNYCRTIELYFQEGKLEELHKLVHLEYFLKGSFQGILKQHTWNKKMNSYCSTARTTVSGLTIMV